MVNHYVVLGLAPGCNRAQLRARYLELAAKYHPDKNVHQTEAIKVEYVTKFREVQTAYEALIVIIERGGQNPNQKSQQQWTHPAQTAPQQAQWQPGTHPYANPRGGGWGYAYPNYYTGANGPWGAGAPYNQGWNQGYYYNGYSYGYGNAAPGSQHPPPQPQQPPQHTTPHPPPQPPPGAPRGPSNHHPFHADPKVNPFWNEKGYDQAQPGPNSNASNSANAAPGGPTKPAANVSSGHKRNATTDKSGEKKKKAKQAKQPLPTKPTAKQDQSKTNNPKAKPDNFQNYHTNPSTTNDSSDAATPDPAPSPALSPEPPLSPYEFTGTCKVHITKQETTFDGSPVFYSSSDPPKFETAVRFSGAPSFLCPVVFHKSAIFCMGNPMFAGAETIFNGPVTFGVAAQTPGCTPHFKGNVVFRSRVDIGTDSRAKTSVIVFDQDVEFYQKAVFKLQGVVFKGRATFHTDVTFGCDVTFDGCPVFNDDSTFTRFTVFKYRPHIYKIKNRRYKDNGGNVFDGEVWTDGTFLLNFAETPFFENNSEYKEEGEI
ncbi:hypothetical protein EJ08DRAFT_691126 [Tothia fuscella]|uniref:J domain-containing protein n=1 Tax=Tothia fuscella TaxID=1048955 RepID=A0A9P4P216_9PEZI|nr:hypothetical protein EJ08DRAFT_691126 [Tothia fuscella]